MIGAVINSSRKSVLYLDKIESSKLDFYFLDTKMHLGIGLNQFQKNCQKTAMQASRMKLEPCRF